MDIAGSCICLLEFAWWPRFFLTRLELFISLSEATTTKLTIEAPRTIVTNFLIWPRNSTLLLQWKKNLQRMYWFWGMNHFSRAQQVPLIFPQTSIDGPPFLLPNSPGIFNFFPHEKLETLCFHGRFSLPLRLKLCHKNWYTSKKL